MRPRFPLYAKILLWFFLNLLLLFIAGWLVVDAQVRSGLNSFLAGYVAQRVEGVARQLTGDLAQAPESEWDTIIQRYSETNGVQFILLSGGERLAGPDLSLPETIRSRIPRGPPGHPPRGRPAAGPDRPSHHEMQGPLDLPGNAGPSPHSTNEAGDSRRPLVPRLLPIHDRFFIRSSQPHAYWAGLLMAMRHVEGFGGPRPVTLLIRSDTFSAGGFFFDFTPWLFGAGGLLLLSVLFWLPLVRHLTAAIARMNAATDQIAEGRFDVSVDEQRRDELGQLGGAINRMAARLQGFVKGQKRFLGDVAHELCSPIARLQMALGILEQHANEKQKPYVEDVREEVQHMSNLVNELLSFSKASLRPAEVRLEPVNVRAVAEQAAQREAAGQGEVQNKVPDDVLALANPELLQRALSNVVRNALRYAGHAGPITITANRRNDQVRVSVADRGPGIPEEHIQQVFDTFYRIETSRDRESGGVGLGLSIVKNCIETCGGTVRARNRRSGGLRVIIELPAAPGSDSSISPTVTESRV